MAYVDTGALLTALRGVLEDAAGSLRVVDTDRFEGGYWPDLDDEEASRRGLVKPRAEVVITRIGRSESSPMSHHSLRLYDVELEVRVLRHIGPVAKVDDASRDAARGLAAQDADVIAQAVEHMGNLDSATTGLVSGRLMYEDSPFFDLRLSDDAAGRVETVHRFSGILQVTQVVA